MAVVFDWSVEPFSIQAYALVDIEVYDELFLFNNN